MRLSGPLARLRSLWRGLRHRSDVEAEIREEFLSHIELRTKDLMAREGIARKEAHRRARLEFGHIERHREDARASRGLRVFDRIGCSWLDVKLGVRMLRRYPGLSVVAVAAMAFAIWVGVGTFEFVHQFVHPALPLPDGDRIVGIRYWDREAAWSRDPTGYDLSVWRDELNTIEHLGGWREAERNLRPPGGVGEPTAVAVISPSAFEVTGVHPLFGRALAPGDAAPGAAPVVVLGHRLWQDRFGGDPNVVGRTVGLDASEATVVGVMPENFAFPVNHQIWTPLPDHAFAADPGAATPLRVFGRLAPDAAIPQTQAQVSTVTGQLQSAWPDVYRHLRAEVLPHAESTYRFSLGGLVRLGMYALNAAVGLLLLLIASNVAMLMFARAAAREREILVRGALGAGRRRIVGQLFVEAVILVGLAAVLAVAAAGFGMEWGLEILRLQLDVPALPFWLDPDLSPLSVLYAVLLTLVAAMLAGVVPALKMTGRGMERRLGRVAAGGGGLHFGRFWTALTVTQVTLTVIFAAVALGMLRASESVRNAEVGVPAREYLAVRLMMDRPEGEGGVARYHASVTELEERLLAEPAVRGVTLGEHLPVMYHPHAIVELDDGGAAEPDPQWGGGYRVSSTAVAADFFEVFGARPTAGRGFDAADFSEEADVVVVNRSFVERVLGGRSAIGRRIRYIGRENQRDGPGDSAETPWYEIIGVVPDLGRRRTWKVDGIDPKVSRIYHTLPPREYPLNLAAHVPAGPATMAPRLRRIAAEVDPALRLHDVQPLDEAVHADVRFYTFWSVLTFLLGGVALTLSMAGIYSVTSFMVSRRTREIGIRLALGAEPRQIMAAILRRPLLEVSAGVLMGCLLVGLFFVMMADAGAGRPENAAWGVVEILAWVLTLGGVMTAACLLGALVPARRALGVGPREALTTDR